MTWRDWFMVTVLLSIVVMAIVNPAAMGRALFAPREWSIAGLIGVLAIAAFLNDAGKPRT